MGSLRVESRPAPLMNGFHSSEESLAIIDRCAYSGAQAPTLRGNDSAKPWVVQKFGGTSVGKEPVIIAEEIIGQWVQRNRVIAVCSARSSHTKTAGTTNRLLRAAKEAGNKQQQLCDQIIELVREDHVAEAKARIRSKQICAELCSQMEWECKRLQKFLSAVGEIGEVSSRTLDTIISKGENLSCRFMAALLQDRGVDAEFVDLADIIKFEADMDDLDNGFYARLTAVFRERMLACGDRVPVVTGYFGAVKGGLLNKIGRGYTDLCAALIAVGVRAEELQIWKEVDGIFTANPSKVPTARLLPTISPAEAAELTFYGSEVIHPFTMEQVIKARIPIRIRNVMNLRNTGTTISPDPVTTPTKPPSLPSSPSFIRRRSSSKIFGHSRPPRPTAITIKHKILVLNVHSNKRSLSHGFFANIFSVLDKWRLSVDLISTSEVHVSMAIHSESALVSGGSNDEEKEIVDASLRGAINDLQQYGTVDAIDGMAILSLVGKQMKNMIGIAGKMFTVLGENNVNIEMISQGASEINISCVIEDRDADRAINILHTNIFTFFD